MTRKELLALTISDLVGRTITKVEGLEPESEEVLLYTSDGLVWRFYHEQDCCERVTLDDIEGDAADIIGVPLTMAEESSNQGPDGDWGGSQTWTFYRFAARGYVTLRWLGMSNGYYSEDVHLSVSEGTVDRRRWYTRELEAMEDGIATQATGSSISWTNGMVTP